MALVNVPHGAGQMYAYECDGLGNFLLMDDAGMPNLTSIPYFGYCDVQDPIYQNSRRLAQSAANPFFYVGSVAEGHGQSTRRGAEHLADGYHRRALTSTNETEIRACIEMLKRSEAGTGFMHESFNKDNAAQFTRALVRLGE